MILPTLSLLALLGASQAAADDPSADLVASHNRERAARQLPPLAAEARLTGAAKAHAADMASHQKMSHEGSDGSTPLDRVKRFKYPYMTSGENVAEGQRSVADVMTSWMNSPHHRENILGDFTEIGVARAMADDGTPYWCVDFGRPYPRLDPPKAETEVAERLNHARSDAGKATLRVDPRLASAARKIAADLASKGTLGDPAEDKEADKDRYGRSSTADRIKESGYKFASLSQGGSVGPPNPDALLKQLLDAPDQKAALLGDSSDLGVGYALSAEGRPFWCLLLAKPLK